MRSSLGPFIQEGIVIVIVIERDSDIIRYFELDAQLLGGIHYATMPQPKTRAEAYQEEVTCAKVKLGKVG
jgi:hypothetical protein